MRKTDIYAVEDDPNDLLSSLNILYKKILTKVNSDIIQEITEKDGKCELDSEDILEKVRERIKRQSDLILYTNLRCDLRIGTSIVTSRYFDTVLESEEYDFSLFLMRHHEYDANSIRTFLDSHGIYYNEINLNPDILNKDDSKIVPEIWFARDIGVLEEAILDSISNNSVLECDYYPHVDSYMSFYYQTLDYEIEGENSLDVREDGEIYKALEKFYNTDEYKAIKDRRCNIDSRVFRGAIKMPDKLILLTASNDLENVGISDVYQIMQQYGFLINTHEYGEPKFPKTKDGEKKII